MAATSGASSASVWVEAARPRTLPAALVPVLVGTGAADAPPADLSWARFALALVVALALQVAVNYANDYFDGVKGVDTAERTGPRRAVAAGLVAPARMRTATALGLAVAAAAGVALAALAGWELLLVGAAAIVAALGYSGGRRPYASRGLGEVFVFVFFGLVATVGSQYVQDGRLGAVAGVAAVGVGAGATALLVVNNLRDVPTDAAAGKRTLAVRLGEDRTRWLYTGLLWTVPPVAGLLALAVQHPGPLLALLATPLAGRATALAHTAGRATAPAAETAPERSRGSQLVTALEVTGRFHLAAGVLLAAGLAWGTA